MSQGLTHARAHRGPGLSLPVGTRLARRAFFARFASLQGGELAFEDAQGTRRFGRADADRLTATVQVRDPDFYSAVALRGSVGAAESYMDGHWTSDDLVKAIRIVARNAGLQHIDRGPARLAQPGLKLLHGLRRNHRAGARRNIAAHYDLGNEFFRLFLDPTLTYSSAVFERADMTLEEAQVAKYERLCRKLALQPSDHVLEIGGGWGGFALHAARHHGCRVTTTTISREQYDLARKRVAEADLESRVNVIFCDYRDLEGTFDKLVSIEMIEAVGARHLLHFFRVCSQRLRPAGLMALQAILVPDKDWEASVRNVDFVKRYIFPGGQLVSIGAISRCLAAETDLRITHLEDITPHYTETLLRWHAAMRSNLGLMRDLGLDETFLRMWEYYLCYCAAGFAERATGANQIVLAKAGARPEPILGGL